MFIMSAFMALIQCNFYFVLNIDVHLRHDTLLDSDVQGTVSATR
jgi:hypothetical protein